MIASIVLPTIPDFKIKKYLGKGRRGRTYQVMREADEGKNKIKTYIMKILHADPYQNWIKIATVLKEEANIIKDLKSQFIVELLLFKATEHYCYWIYEECPVGSLRSYLNALTPRKLRPSEKQLSLWLINLINGLNYLHQNNIFHCELKPEYIFIMENFTVKIGGLMPKSRNIYINNRFTENGMPFYSAPELLVDEKYLGSHSDIFSLGAILYECASLIKPFPDRYALGRFKEKGVLPPLPQNLAQQFRDIILSCLKRDPTQRPTISQLSSNSYVNKYVYEAEHPSPQNLDYPDITCVVGEFVEPIQPTIEGIPTFYQITPDLPEGMTLDATTGVISGTPTEPSKYQEYTVEAVNDNGSCKAQFFLLVIAHAPPEDFQYPKSYWLLRVEEPIKEPIVPLCVNDPETIICPNNLPEGLIFDPYIGAVSGTPRIASKPEKYNIIAKNRFGLSLTTVTIEVCDIFDYRDTSY